MVCYLYSMLYCYINISVSPRVVQLVCPAPGKRPSDMCVCMLAGFFATAQRPSDRSDRPGSAPVADHGSSAAIFQTNISQTEILQVESPGESPVSGGISPLGNEILTESHRSARRILARETAAASDRKSPLYIYIYIYI